MEGRLVTLENICFPIVLKDYSIWRGLDVESYKNNLTEFFPYYFSLLTSDPVFTRTIDEEKYKPGHITFSIGRTPYQMYKLMDEEMEEHKDGPYVVYGILLRKDFLVTFYKWERFAEDVPLLRSVCGNSYDFNDTTDVYDFISPTVRGMLTQVPSAYMVTVDADFNVPPREYYDKRPEYPKRAQIAF